MKAIDIVVEAALAALMAVLLVLIFAAVVFRYVIGSPITWSEELGRFCLVWASFLGAYLAHRRAEHIAVTVFRERMPIVYQKVLSACLALLLLAFLGVLTWFGTVYSLKFMASSTPLLKIPVGLIYSAMPITMFLIMLSVLASFRERDETSGG